MSHLFKPLFDKAGLNWKPDKELVESVKDKELQENTYYSDYEELRKIFDPGIDVYP